MQTILITAVLVAAIVLIHFAYVDFRFRYREGMHWFWMLNPAPPIIWIARAFFVAAVIAAFCMHWIGMNPTFYWILGGLMGLHLISMILVEVLEHR